MFKTRNWSEASQKSLPVIGSPAPAAASVSCGCDVGTTRNHGPGRITSPQQLQLRLQFMGASWLLTAGITCGFFLWPVGAKMEHIFKVSRREPTRLETWFFLGVKRVDFGEHLLFWWWSLICSAGDDRKFGRTEVSCGDISNFHEGRIRVMSGSLSLSQEPDRKMQPNHFDGPEE